MQAAGCNTIFLFAFCEVAPEPYTYTVCLPKYIQVCYSSMIAAICIRHLAILEGYSAARIMQPGADNGFLFIFRSFCTALIHT